MTFFYAANDLEKAREAKDIIDEIVDDYQENF